VKEHHRHHHRGLTEFIVMGLDGIGEEDEAKAEVLDKLQDDLLACQKPSREANRAILGVLGEGMAGGAIDGAKVEALIAQAVEAAGAVRDCRAGVLDALHAALSPAERNALADKVEANWAVWREQNAEARAAREKGGRLHRLAQKLDLSPEQVEKMAAALEPALANLPRRFDPKRVEAQIEAFAGAFVAEKFDAKALAESSGPELAAQGATRMAKFYETVLPLMTPEQRAKLAEDLKARASEPPAGSQG